jgi:hypothetical protein
VAVFEPAFLWAWVLATVLAVLWILFGWAMSRGNRKSTPRSELRTDPVLQALQEIDEIAKQRRSERLDAVRSARDRAECLERSADLWRQDAAMLPLILAKWDIDPEDIRKVPRDYSSPDQRVTSSLFVRFRGSVPASWQRAWW